MSDKAKKSAVIALGFFDGVHLGHLEVISRAKELAKSCGAITVALTFSGNLKGVFKADEKNILSSSERERALLLSGADEVFFAPISSEFLSLSAIEFLEFLDEKYSVVGYVSGEDYRFGKNGSGNVGTLREYAKNNNRTVITVGGVIIDGERVSSTAIKSALKAGDVKRANAYLGRPYAVTGSVFEDRKVGKSLGFPTVNVKIDKEKAKLLDGVYAGKITLDGKEYRTIINYGARPTFDLEEKLIEAHIIDFCGNLYGKEITLKFTGFIRKIQKFDGATELACQLRKDVENTKAGKYD